MRDAGLHANLLVELARRRRGLRFADLDAALGHAPAPGPVRSLAQEDVAVRVEHQRGGAAAVLEPAHLHLALLGINLLAVFANLGGRHGEDAAGGMDATRAAMGGEGTRGEGGERRASDAESPEHRRARGEVCWSGDCQKFIGRNAKRSDIVQVLPGFEPGTLDSKSRVLNHYTTEPSYGSKLRKPVIQPVDLYQTNQCLVCDL